MGKVSVYLVHIVLNPGAGTRGLVTLSKDSATALHTHILFGFDRGSPTPPGWPRIHLVVQAGFEPVVLLFS